MVEASTAANSGLLSKQRLHLLKHCITLHGITSFSSRFFYKVTSTSKTNIVYLQLLYVSGHSLVPMMITYGELKYNCNHGHHSLLDKAMWDKHPWRAEIRGDWSFSIPSGRGGTFSDEGPLLTALRLLSSLFFRSFPGGQIKCHVWDCEMRSALGSLSSPQESAVITLAVEITVGGDGTKESSQRRSTPPHKEFKGCTNVKIWTT